MREYAVKRGGEKLFNCLNIIKLGKGFVNRNSESIPPILTLADIILLLFLIAT
jgi:hypothetical protein